VFPDKQSLYRSEKDDRVIVMRWWRIAAAAVVLLFLGVAAWMYVGNKGVDKTNPVAIKINTPTDKPSETITTPGNKTDNLVQTDGQPNNNNEELNPKQSSKITQKAITPQDQPERVLIAEIKSSNVGNIQEGSNVKQIDETVVMVEPKTIETAKPIVDQEKTLAKLNENDPQPSQATYASNIDDNSQIEVLNTTVSNKSKMRGFFRKVGRVVDKATNIGPTDESEDKKGIRIASFQIALK
jgi:hypothetical protein